MAKLEIFNEKSSNHNISIPIVVFLFIIVILAIGWLLAFYILGDKSFPGFKNLPFFFGFEIANAVLVGGTVGFFVNKYLK